MDIDRSDKCFVGVNKSILVTTSDYGTDSYEFVKGKPITPINGSNLLFLLNKHGYKAKTDIEEAIKKPMSQGEVVLSRQF